ncbi:hypothetical protein PYW08_016663 [Mythimna loreyi]|uniref:Uncharacterized protein n=1 Tax=Mythimna loreyi TaxID=667449 RepID=A0ACC2QXL4_9NEOP|nr:hypothetical protein PYW08_016663 [Mythimna loreyi]
MAKMLKSLKVWSKFSAVSKKTGQTCHFRMTDMPDYLRDHVVNLYIEYYVKEEAICKAVGVPKSIKALNEVRANILKATERPDSHTVVCCEDNGDEKIQDIVGASILTLQYKGQEEPKWKYETQEVKKLLEIESSLADCFDEMKAYNLDRALRDKGAFVRPEYSGFGISAEYVNVRRMICKELGIPMHGAWVTAHGMQGGTERSGCENVYEIPLQDIARKHGVTLKDDLPSYKYMVVKVENNN